MFCNRASTCTKPQTDGEGHGYGHNDGMNKSTFCIRIQASINIVERNKDVKLV